MIQANSNHPSNVPLVLLLPWDSVYIIIYRDTLLYLQRAFLFFVTDSKWFEWCYARCMANVKRQLLLAITNSLFLFLFFVRCINLRRTKKRRHCLIRKINHEQRSTNIYVIFYSQKWKIHKHTTLPNHFTNLITLLIAFFLSSRRRKRETNGQTIK